MDKLTVFLKYACAFLIGVLFGCWLIYNFLYSYNDLFDTIFDFSIVDIIGLLVQVCIGYLVYKYTKKDSKEDKINNKRLELLEKVYKLVESKMNNIIDLTRNEFKISIQEIQNVSKALEDLCKDSIYETNAEYIDKNLSDLESYIFEEMEDIEMHQMFDSETRKEKIEKFIKNITSKCNETIVCIYKN